MVHGCPSFPEKSMTNGIALERVSDCEYLLDNGFYNDQIENYKHRQQESKWKELANQTQYQEIVK